MPHLGAGDDLLHVAPGGGDFLPGAPQPLDAPAAKLLEALSLAAAAAIRVIGSGGVLATPAPFRASHSTSLSRTETLLVGLRAIGKWNAMALVGPASRFEEPRRGRGRISEARGGLLRAPPTPKRLGESSLDLSMNSTVLVFTLNFTIPYHRIAVFHSSKSVQSSRLSCLR